MFFFASSEDLQNFTQNELEALAQVIHDTDSEEEVGGEADISDESEGIEEDNHNSNSEQEMSEQEENGEVEGEQYSDSDDVPLSVLVANEGQYVGKDKKTIWYKTYPRSKSTKPRSKNIIKILPGPKQCARDITDEISAFTKMFNDEMVEHIIQCTNLEISRVQPNSDRVRDAKNVTKSEMLAFIGLLFLSGAKKQNHTHFLELWTKDGTGSEIFQSYQRFLFLLANIRFDNKITRHERRQTDKLAAVRFILDKFVNNCKKNYSVGEFMTIDEMLIAFRGRCSFVQYIPNKPAKYGLKVFVLCDAQTFYVSNLELYCGKQADGPYNQSNTPTAIVHRLLEEQKLSNRNLTCDNWYSSYPLALELLQDKITFIGTLKKK
ncbi:piggyBac transposable element-derived protein 4-like [Onthophagus taurus]|uniref:piggyBac transposable element-derived protein 4-like n=1 Tax=Onthophagus taurus TaxID=166361 RepID=UPI0039BEA265